MATTDNPAFNSLSRDHFVEKELLGTRLAVEELSTPSLGITRGLSGRPPFRGVTGFQLPLSGSRAQQLEFLRGKDAIFQLPLSGSREYCLRPNANPGDDLSTPSLGITWREKGRDYLIRHFLCFQLPLSGSLAKLPPSMEIEVGFHFQLPLSGSPSPIPGFFGSPRLSAAAPLRTNDS